MTINHTFTDTNYKYVNGKCVSEDVVVDDVLIPIDLTMGNEKRTLYYRKSVYDFAVSRPDMRHWLTLYTESGDYARGTWQHGRYGSKRHKEGLKLSFPALKLNTVTSYASGQKRDQMKYLLSLNA